MNNENYKKCSSCKVFKDEDSFYKDKTKSKGLSQRCKDCDKQRTKNYYQYNSEDIKQKNKDKYNRKLIQLEEE